MAEIKFIDNKDLVIDTIQFLRDLDIVEDLVKLQQGKSEMTLMNVISLVLDKAADNYGALDNLLIKATTIEDVEELSALSGDEYLDLVESFFGTALFKRVFKRFSQQD